MKKLMLLLLILLMAGVVQASNEAGTPPTSQWQAVGEVLYDTPVEGEITADQTAQTWTLSKLTPDRIQVRVERLTGNLIPDVNLLDSNGQPLAFSYGPDDTYAVAFIEEFTLPVEGNYQLVVGREGGLGGVTVGTYRLTVTPLALAPDHANNVDPIGAITYDTPVEGDITGLGWRDVYQLTAPAPDRVYVRVDRKDGNLSPFVEILDSNGLAVATGYTDGRTRAFAEVEYTMPGGGEYAIAVSRNNGFEGDTTGSYTLTVELLGAGEGNPTLAAAPTPLAYDTPVQGTISGASWYVDYLITAPAADSILVEMTRDEGTVLPHLILFSSNGQEINRGYTEEETDKAFMFYNLDVPGEYILRATRENEQNGATTGVYTLTVNLFGSGEGSPNLAASPDAVVTADTPVTGQITNTRWMDTWQFTAQADQQVVIEVIRTEGTLVPELQVLDSNGQVVDDAYFNPTADSTLIEPFNVPGSGTYQIVVFRTSRQNGETRGAYQLSVTPYVPPQ